LGFGSPVFAKSFLCVGGPQRLRQASADTNPLQCNEKANIPCAEIGSVEDGPPAVWRKTEAGRESWPRPERDEIARVFEPLQTAAD
jgi:hypothetical protein